MSKEALIEKKTLHMNGFSLHLEIYDNEIRIKDDYENSMKITKRSRKSIVLNLSGFFSSKK
jgi:hypothetical protein